MCKNGEKYKRDKDMEKVIRNAKIDKTETRNIEDILNKGIKRYDKALKKLSKN